MKKYSSWYPLNEEGLEASSLEGEAAVQVRRQRGLLDYGHGKSAMVWYGYFQKNSRRRLQEVFQDEWDQPGIRGQGPLVFRYYSGEDAEESMVRRARQFAKRFGGPPLFHRSTTNTEI